MVAYDQNGSRNDAWLCLRMLEKFKRQLRKISILGAVISDISKEVNPCFRVKIEKFLNFCLWSKWIKKWSLKMF